MVLGFTYRYLKVLEKFYSITTWLSRCAVLGAVYILGVGSLAAPTEACRTEDFREAGQATVQLLEERLSTLLGHTSR